ncbi:MAG: hypothetical protein IPO21_16340 [Bacteroidales bacterium]|nr:hypothetical protein [Bacteroidales bacterium]
MKKYVCFIVFVTMFKILSAQGFDGAENTITYYDISGDTKECYQNIWYKNTEAEYYGDEKEAYNKRKIAFRNEKFQMIADDNTIEVLKSLGIFTGLMRGYYYPQGASIEEINLKQAFIAYLGIDVKKYDIRVKFVGEHLQYMLNYKLKPQKKFKYAVFRIPSNAYTEDHEYVISATSTQYLLTIKATYNNQELTLTVSRRVSKLTAWFKKIGLNKKKEPLL